MERRLPQDNRSPLRIVDGNHLTEAALDAYSLGRMTAEGDLAELEEHLLVCGWCQDRLEKLDTFHQAIVDSAKLAAQTSTNRKPKAFIPIVIAAGLAGILLMPVMTERFSATVAVDVQAYRNESSNALPAGRKLEIRPDLSGLDTTDVYCQLISADGRIVVAGLISPQRPLILSPALSPGQHWLRLRSVNESGELVREFSLLVR